MYQRLQRTCRASVLLIKTIVFLTFSPPSSSSSLLKVPNITKVVLNNFISKRPYVVCGTKTTE